MAPPPPRAEAHPSLCLKASQLLWGCQTSRIRTSLSCSLRIHSADPDATQDQMRDLPAPVYVSWRACAGSRTTRGRNSSCDNDLLRVAFRAIRRRRPPKFILLSRLNIQPARLPVNASPLLSRTTTHDSGPIWFATPSLGGTCTRETYRFVPAHFAVGTALTGGPPHRSQRALLTHWAPTSGHDAQSLFGVRVQNTNRWKPAVGQTVHALPGHPVSLAPLP